MRRKWRIFAYNLILELANEYEIDPAEILETWGFTKYERRKFYEWCNSSEI